MHLVNNIYFVFSYLRGEAHLIGEVADAFHGIVGSGIQLENIQGIAAAKGFARITFPACFNLFIDLLTVDYPCKNPCTSCFTYTSRPAKKKCLSYLLLPYRILQGGGDSVLPNNLIKSCRAVF